MRIGTTSSTTPEPEMPEMLDGMGPDQPIVIEANGAGQSDIPYRMDLLDPQALMAAAKVLRAGAEKYGAGNWRDLPIRFHLNHLLAHTYAYLAGDDQDEHLSHVLCRALFALGCELDGKKLTPEREMEDG
jgi:hypothetical protein